MRTEPVFTPNSVILYVSDVKASTGFYRKILGSGPVETYPGFSVFSLSDGMTLGLQAADQIEPAAEPYIGGGELSLSNVESADVVDRLYARWKTLGISMVLEPTTLEFGYTFVAADPDGHRLRVCATDTSSFN